MSFFAMGAGIGTKNSYDEWLEVYFPTPVIQLDKSLIDRITLLTGHSDKQNQTIEIDSPTCHALETLFIKEKMLHLATSMALLECSSQPRVLVILEDDLAPATIPEAYLKLHLLSHRLLKPHQVNLSNIFSLLPNVAWSNKGAIDLNELSEKQLLARAHGEPLQVYSIDKFPKMVDYIVPEGVRIADTARVRLGAYVGEGTTVMHEGFINFNAGTEGPNMVEGRISSGVFVDKDSDLGGGCSTMGTLSGGNDQIISVGRNCLIGANAGIGISLGDNCTVEAGLYITAGAKISLSKRQKQ